MRTLRTILTSALIALPLTVTAAPGDGTGGFQIQSIFTNLVLAFANIWIPVAILVVVVAGFTLMLSQSEEALDKAKKTIISVIVGGILLTIFLVLGPVTVVTSLYNALPGVELLNPVSMGLVYGGEAEGVAGWLTAMAAMLGVLIIIIGALRAVTSFGSDEAAYANVRLSILHAVIGLIVIAGAYVIREVFFVDHEPSALIALIAGKLLILLGFILLIAVAILIYAGFRMIIGFGRDEDYTAAKSLAYRVVVGIIVIILSYALVLTVALIFT